MVLDYSTIGDIYWDFCVYDRRLDLNRLSNNLYETCAHLMKFNKEDIEGNGYAHMLFAICRIFEKILKTESYYREYYPILFKVIPEDSMKAIIYKSRIVNEPLIIDGIEPKDLFELPGTGGVDYWQ